MKNVLLTMVALFMFAMPAIAQDRAELMSQVSAIAELTTVNTDNIVKLDDRTGALERAVFGYEETYTVQEPVTVMRSVKKTRAVPPLLFNSVPTAASAVVVSQPNYRRTVTRTVSRPVATTTTVRRRTRRPFFSRASVAMCPTGL